MKKQIEWFLVINETRARIIRGLPGPGVAKVPELEIHAESHKLRDIMADKAGRSFSSGSLGRRSAMEYGNDPLLHERIAFVRQAFALVETHRLAGAFDQLALVAGPAMLGLLRDEMPNTLRCNVSREIARNLAGLTEASLTDALKHETDQG